jgi:hypothetical protein
MQYNNFFVSHTLSHFYCCSLFFYFIRWQVGFLSFAVTYRERRRKRADNWHFTHIFFLLFSFSKCVHPLDWCKKERKRMAQDDWQFKFSIEKENGSIWIWEINFFENYFQFPVFLYIWPCNKTVYISISL